MYGSAIDRIFIALAVIACVAVAAPTLLADCDQPDAPDCECFDDTATWDPEGIGAPETWIIQDVARDTIGLRESCNCPGTLDCDWDPDPDDEENDFKNAGKPYYQVNLGINREYEARWMAEALKADPDLDVHQREAWCSEAVSYWHRETGIPYELGYQNDAYLDWLITSVADLRLWYENEEGRDGGRGRWIPAVDLDYENFELGVTAPVPGAYVAIAEFSYGPPAEYTSMDTSHSLIIDRMWVDRDGHGNVFRVEVWLIEGNSSGQVTTDHWPDLLTFTPQGSQWVSHSRGPDGEWETDDDVRRKIYGFGIDLDENGQPIYDPFKLREETHPSILRAIVTDPITVQDDDWMQCSAVLPDWIEYSDTVSEEGGPSVKWGFGVADPVPDGQPQNAMSFPDDYVGEVIINLAAPYPLPIRGLELTWGAGSLPLGYSVEFFPEDGPGEAAVVPDLSAVEPPPDLPATVPVALDQPMTGVRYVRLFFPQGSFVEPAVLEKLRLRHEGSPWEDAEGKLNEPQFPVFVDIKPGSCPNPVNPDAHGVLHVAILGGAQLDVTTIDTASVRLGGQAPLRWSYGDTATPFIGSSGECHQLGGDGYPDLRLKFDNRAVAEHLDLESRRGETISVEIRGRLHEAHEGEFVFGQDWIRVVGQRRARTRSRFEWASQGKD